MSYLILARKYRPQTFDELIGQEHVAQTLKNSIVRDRLAQSFLFVGSRGIGKTSTARILAKVLNCTKRQSNDPNPCNRCDSCKEITDGVNLDVLEIDGASNRGIDEIRNLRENVKFKPAQSAFKIYIIDEVHMLTTEAFNALLKTLEEPPTHVKFIFATTEPHRVPATIISRTQRYDFRRIPTRLIAETLESVAKREKIKIDTKALFLIAKAAEGSLRDGESLLDQLLSYAEGTIVADDIEKALGGTTEAAYIDIVNALAVQDSQTVLQQFQVTVSEGKDIKHFVKGLLEIFRDILVIKSTAESEKLIERTDEGTAVLNEKASLFTVPELLYMLTVIQNLINQIKHSTFPQIYVEIGLIKLAQREHVIALSELVNRIEQGEKNGALQKKTITERTTEPVQKKKPKAPSPAVQHIEEQVDEYLQETPHAKPEEAAAQNAPGTPEAVQFQQIAAQWTVVLQKVKEARMSTGVFLSEAEPLELSGSVLTLGMPKELKFHKETLGATENKKLIEDVVREIFSIPLKVSLVLTEREGHEAVLDDADSGADQNEIIESALNIFQGKTIRRG